MSSDRSRLKGGTFDTAVNALEEGLRKCILANDICNSLKAVTDYLHRSAVS